MFLSFVRAFAAAPYSVAYTQLRTQAIVEAHRLVKTEALKSAWDNDRYPK